MLIIKNLKKSFNNRIILDIPLLTFERGKIYTIVGNNGAGKSTFLRILYGLEDFDEGEFFLDGEILKDENRFQKIIFNPQTPLFFKGTVEYNLREPFKLRNLPFPEEKTNELLNEFGLEKLRYSDIETLSGGEKAKVQFVRTLLYDRDYLLLDEPTASTDKETTQTIEKFILNCKKLNKTVIMITHSFYQNEKISDLTITI
ncbi:ATP-binding cassette domain-containing protein [Cetobacterium sp. 2A]|uniref:ATP-binding cassette domain-containing protein n=1 Tax=unclassified Cetobacterium TaxID=2630983 RepID=UPI00163B9C47|nr:ATP-binding cassette domain-containing protein [Cetobacterium sp. 2A]MBC2854991.1 ATP-binding cassette domain-containing protein [Cetobacterium sp. 2A]